MQTSTILLLGWDSLENHAIITEPENELIPLSQITRSAYGANNKMFRGISPRLLLSKVFCPNQG
jgi:hypothetical protein